MEAWEWDYSMAQSRRGRELIVRNFDVPRTLVSWAFRRYKAIISMTIQSEA